MILDMFNESTLFGQNPVVEQEEENLLEGVEAIALDESEDPVAACYRITLENEQNWFNMTNTIATCEVNYLKNGGDLAVMYEAVDFKQIKNTVVEWIQKQWAKLKGVFQKAISALQEKIFHDKALVTAYENRVKTNPKVKQIKTEKEYTLANMSAIETYAASLGGFIKYDFGKLLDFASFEDEKSCDDILKQFGGDAIKKSTKAEEAKKDIMAAPAKISAEEAYTVVKNGKQVDAIKKAFKHEEKYFSDLLKQFKDAKKDLKGDKNAGKAVSVIHLQSKACKFAIADLNTAARVCISAANHHYNVHRSVLNKLVGIKIDKKAEKNEKKVLNASANLLCELI